MNKSFNMPVILLEELTMEKLLSVFELGNEIVFIIQYNGKFIGGITQGDFKRSLKSDTLYGASEIINTKMHKIIINDEKDESYARKEARRIFYKYSCINNIPVVDINGKLCFQYEREKEALKNRIGHYLNIVDDDLVFEVFFKCYENFDIVITGAEPSILNKVKNLFESKYKHILKERNNINIFIKSLSECSLLGKESIVITVTYFGKVYLEINNAHCKAEIISLESLAAYRNYNQIYKFSKETLLAWVHLFDYEEIIIMEYNPYTIYIKSVLESCKLDVKFIEDSKYKLLELKKDGAQILLTSGRGKFIEKMSFDRFIGIVRLIDDYYKVSGIPLLADNYINAFLHILKSLEKQGVKVLYYEVFNNLDLQLKLKLGSSVKVKVVDSNKESLCDERSIKDCRNSMFGEKVQTLDFIFECIQYSIDNIIYNKLKKLCKNVYKFNIRNLKYEHICYNLFQNRMNYTREGKNMFPENFLEDIYGDKDYPIEELLDDISGCNIVEVSGSYIKYQSNYSSINFNTDIYGNRITTNIPKEYNNNIFLLGSCMMSGYAVCDNDTLASCIQRGLNESNLLYRVVNLGIDNGYNQYIYQKIAEHNIFCNDIIIMQFSWADADDKYTLSIDYEKIFSVFKGKRFYWDSVCHCNNKTYKLIADDILENIKTEIITEPENIVFKLDTNMENEINKYINEVQYKVSEYYQYKDICMKTGIKAGAIVMNCNPFTYGHKYLVETASRLVDILYIFVVEEDKFIFSFEERFKMVWEGVKEFCNVIVIPAGKFMISTLTFPGYFMKESLTERYFDSFLDLKIFAEYIAPAFGISVRFVGTEPSDEVTAQYNKDMHIILVNSGIDVIEIPRKKIGDKVISASSVRQLIKNGKWKEIKTLVPETTYKVLEKKELAGGNI